MSNPIPDELELLRSQLQQLRQQQAVDQMSFRMHERDVEFRHRMMDLDLAGSGIPPVGPDPHSPIHGAASLVEIMSNVDVDRVSNAVNEIHTRGYVIVPGVLDEAGIAQTRTSMADLFDSTRRLFQRSPSGRQSDQTVHIQNVLGKTAAVDNIAVNPLLRGIAAGVLGYDFILNAGAVAMAPDPGCAAQGLHRDDGFFALFPRPHLPLVLTAAIALDEFTQATGATHLIPGSQLWPSHRMPEEHEVIRAEMVAGSMLVWDGAIYHGGGANQTKDQTRRTLTFNYTRGWLRTQFNQYLSVPRERVLSMPVELQADLGYHRSALGLGGCDLQDPLQYLQRLMLAGGDGYQRVLGRESSD